MEKLEGARGQAIGILLRAYEEIIDSDTWLSDWSMVFFLRVRMPERIIASAIRYVLARER